MNLKRFIRKGNRLIFLYLKNAFGNDSHFLTLRDVLGRPISLFNHLKINTVIQPELNFDEITPISELARDNPVDVRFIEQMPFQGDQPFVSETISAKEIRNRLQAEYPNLTPIISRKSTTQQFTNENSLKSTLIVL